MFTFIYLKLNTMVAFKSGGVRSLATRQTVLESEALRVRGDLHGTKYLLESYEENFLLNFSDEPSQPTKVVEWWLRQ
jgi:hypothetical protein